MMKANDSSGVEAMISPIETCINEGCQGAGKTLGGKNRPYQGVLFTRDRGVLPICISTLYCRCAFSSTHITPVSVPDQYADCSTTYRPNYYVHNADNHAAVRQYASGIPQYLEITQHSYVERDLVEVFRNQMAFTQYVPLPYHPSLEMLT